MRTRTRTRPGAAVAGVCTAAAVLITTSACTTGSHARTTAAVANQAGPQSGIHRATTSGQLRDGHFSDPYPLNGSITAGAPPTMMFSGTFNEIMTCSGEMRTGCFTPRKISTSFGPSLLEEFKANHVTAPDTKAHHIYHRANGSWDMIVTSKVHQGKRAWNDIFHAHAASAPADGVPTKWVVDSLLTGSIKHPVQADYDGKLLDSNGTFYLVYSGLIAKGPVFAVVAKRLVSPSKPSNDKPVTLLRPAAGRHALNSETRFAGRQPTFKLTETGNIYNINGKWVMVYAVGAFDRDDYKIGIAYSDTLLPGKGHQWRKLHLVDQRGVWGKKGANEVRYLLQSQKEQWPNYVASSVKGPGVGSLIHNDGRWYLFFAGYAPSERIDHDGKFDASHRQPYFVPLRLHIPQSGSVAKASNATLVSWVRPRL